MTRNVEYDQTPGVHVEVDLKLIREKRNVSIEELHLKTKIPVEVLHQFEQGVLTSEPQFNRVYLRAIVRTYAGLIGISPDLAVESLEASLSGRYQGELARKYLDVELPEPAPPPPEEPSGEEPETPPEQPSVPFAAPEPPPTGIIEHIDRPLYEVDVRPPVNWRRVSVIIVLVLAFAVALWLILSAIQSPPDTAETAVPEPPETQAEPSPVVLGPTISLTVIAADAPLGPVRIAIDEGTQNPYWVEQGDSIHFAGTQRFEITGDLGAARVLVEGIEWPTEGLGPRSSLTLTRDAIETQFGTQRTGRFPDT